MHFLVGTDCVGTVGSDPMRRAYVFADRHFAQLDHHRISGRGKATPFFISAAIQIRRDVTTA